MNKYKHHDMTVVLQLDVKQKIKMINSSANNNNKISKQIIKYISTLTKK